MCQFTSIAMTGLNGSVFGLTLRKPYTRRTRFWFHLKLQGIQSYWQFSSDSISHTELRLVHNQNKIVRTITYCFKLKEARISTSACTQKSFRNHIKKTEIRLYLPFYDWFEIKRMSVWIQINRKMVNTICFRVALIILRKDFFASMIMKVGQPPACLFGPNKWMNSGVYWSYIYRTFVIKWLKVQSFIERKSDRGLKVQSFIENFFMYT